MKVDSQILPPIITKNLAEIFRLCQQHYIKRFWLFGSVIREDFGPKSDIDVLYEFDLRRMPDEEYLDHFWGFWEELEKLFGRKVDFIHYPSIRNPYFKEEVDETKRLIYDQERQKVFV